MILFYYNSLLNDMYRDLSGQVKVNHISEVESAGASSYHSHCFQGEVAQVQLSSGSSGTFSSKVKGFETHGIKPIQGCGDVEKLPSRGSAGVP